MVPTWLGEERCPGGLWVPLLCTQGLRANDLASRRCCSGLWTGFPLNCCQYTNPLTFVMSFQDHRDPWRQGPWSSLPRKESRAAQKARVFWPSLGKGKLAPYRAMPPMLTFFLPASDANPFTWLPLPSQPPCMSYCWCTRVPWALIPRPRGGGVFGEKSRGPETKPSSY